MATVKEVIEKAYTKVNGEYEAVTEGSDDFNTYLSVLNQVMEQWFDTPYVKWQSLFNPSYQLPSTVSGGQLVYPIEDAEAIRIANSPLDSVYFVDDNEVVMGKYKMLDQALFQASNSANTCAVFGGDLHLKSVEDKIVGTHIRIPAYVKPPAYKLGSEKVKVDSTPWLIAAMSASICDASPVPFIARNADKYYKQAEVFMKTMREDNRRRQILSLKGTANRTITSLSGAIDAGVGVGGGSFDNIDGGQF